eukprot:TRINITY_DN2222_c0_g1_i1.p1 TRINITY_DN2222_c0_g1~~TRINITY_DN2222_c0_g1_i1.p1  ORF type:complete len:320 (-),score=86.95 TRINITY_DN2222_c0_g1_i1:57-1016(-)
MCRCVGNYSSAWRFPPQFSRVRQFADIPNRKSGFGVVRHHRDAPNKVLSAVKAWNEHGRLAFAVNLGDTIDYRCGSSDAAAATLQRMTDMLAASHCPVYSVIGNHDVYWLPREHVIGTLRIESPLPAAAYYDFSPAVGWRVVALDSFDLSLSGYPPEHEHRQAAQRMYAAGLRSGEAHFQPFNGGVSHAQLAWLDGVLRRARASGERVLLVTHCPLSPHASYGVGDAVLWNYEQVLQQLHKYDNVVCCFYGHEHMGGYAIDSAGVHHVVVEAALESPQGAASHAVATVYADRIEVAGHGNVRSRTIRFSPLCSEEPRTH